MLNKGRTHEQAIHEVLAAPIVDSDSGYCDDNFAGGAISFNCGPELVEIVVNTNATDQTVVVNGGGLVRLSGNRERQIFFVFGSGNLTMRKAARRSTSVAIHARLALAATSTPSSAMRWYTCRWCGSEEKGEGRNAKGAYR